MKSTDQDEDYLISRAKRNGLSEENGAENVKALSKSWLITARVMYPGNFNIQYEAYSMMKDEENANDAAKAFQELFKEFVGKSKSVEKLWSELDEMIEILATPGRENSFLHLIFDKMDSTTQREILLSSSARAKDPLIRIKRILIAFQKFPDLIPKHGMDNCLGYILNLCKSRVRQQAVVDDLLELLLTEVAPLLVPVPSLEIEYNALNDLLLLTFEYIFAVLLHGQDKVNDISWSNLIHLFGEIGKRLQWSFSTVLLKPSQKDQNIYHHLVAFLQGKSTILNIGRLAEGIHEDIKGQVFYVGTLMFLKTLSDYLIYTQGLGNVNNPAILVEAFVTHEDSDNEPLAKRRRTTDEERRIPDVTHHGDGGGGVGGPDQPLVNGFLNAVRYYELLASDPDLINRLQRQVHPPDNLIYPFIADTYIYQGRFKEAFATLRHLPPPKLPIAQCQYFLKNASLYHATNNLQDMTDQTWQALAILSTLKSEHNHHENTNIAKNTENVTIKDSRNPKASRNGKELTLPTSKMRHIHFLDFNRQSIISYATRLLIYGLKEKVMQPIAKNDLCIGHIISLLQYSFPEESDLFFMILHRIKMSETFTYPIFMHHIVHIEFLEEFSNFMVDNTNTVTLDIAPTNTGAPSASSTDGRKRLGTRGANRGEKTEIKSALKKQAARSYENLDEVILDFVSKNRDSLFQCML